jgi:glycosyltransferase involved in cell wall biosynthesis
LRVLYVNHTAEVSGGERSLLTLLEALPRGIVPHVATPHGPLEEAVTALGIAVTPIVATGGSLRLHPIHTSRAAAEMGVAAAQLHRAARRHRADIVHANSARAGIEVALARVANAARIVHVRDILPAGRVTSASMRLIARTATVVLANSQFTARNVLAAVPDAPVEVVYPAIDLARFDPSRIDRARARSQLGALGAEGALLGVVAQLSPWKGQQTAIEALRMLLDAGIQAHLLLIGSAKFVARSTRFDNDAYVARLRQLVTSLGLEDRVSFLGERDDIPELVRALDLLLLPSEAEPFGRALLEAMALEVPVLATNVGGPPELVRDDRDGYLLPPGQPAAWAHAARKILESPDRARQMGRSGRARIAEMFGVDVQAAATREVYERAVARNQSAAA